jgi:hypothetical protein
VLDDNSMMLTQFEVWSGVQSRCFATGLVPGASNQIALYQPNGIAVCW